MGLSYSTKFVKSISSDITAIILLFLVFSHVTAESSLQQPVGVANESYTSLQPEPVEVTEPLQGPQGMLVMC